MAVVNFPDSPSDGATQTVGGITYTYSSSKGYWTAAASSGGGGVGGASVTTDDTAPSSPSDGDLWYDTDDGGMFVYYEDTDSSQWVEVIGSQGSPGADGAAGADGADGAAGADGGAGVASVYATIDLLPLTGNTQGDMAHVTANNTLYFWNGSGWYKIALINTNPSISGVASAYDLAIDGTATTVTVTASDPEGIPITYSIASDTSGNIATVSQGTGASTNVFTITPTTNTANAGSFSLTFRASDGVNIATAPATFTLQFIVTNSNYTTALITTSGSAGTNSSFTDSSSNSHTITANGNATQTSFSPYRHGGYSTYFDGTGDYLSAGDDATFELGSGDFTIETWVYLTGYSNSYSGYYAAGICGKDNTTTRSYSFQIAGTASSYTGLYFNMFVGGSPNDTYYLTTFNLNQWYHIAVSRESGTLRLFIDGALVQTNTSATQTPTEGSQPFVIGAGSTYTGYEYRLPGYLTDFRFVKGTAVYTAAFTPPTERLTAITNTSLLTCHLPYFADGSTNNHTITPNGDAATKPFAPYDYQEYAVGDHGGSAYFDGTGDYVEMAGHSSLALDTSNFTVEFWYKHVANVAAMRFLGNNYQNSTWGGGRWTMGIVNGKLMFQSYSLHGTGSNTLSTVNIDDGSWHHCSLTRTGSIFTLRVDGTDPVTYTNSGSIDGNNLYGFTVGARGNGAEATNGYISDFRLVKGTAVYTADFTPPTAPLTAITNTSLLLGMQGAKILDKAQSTQNLTLVGNTTASTAQYKYLPTSMYFDGTVDCISLTPGYDDPLYNFGTHDWTLEGWFYIQTLGGGRNLFSLLRASTNEATPHIYTNNTNLVYYVLGANRIEVDALTINTWQHIAVTRSGNDHKLFVDGTQVGSTWTSAQTYVQGRPVLGSYHNSLGTLANGTNLLHGYAQDFRITKGLARYTANFTPPTAALQG